MTVAARSGWPSVARSGLLLLALSVALLCTTPAAHAITATPHTAPVPTNRCVSVSEPSAADNGLRMDRQAQVLSSTGYQTMVIASLVGGVAIVGAFAGGVHPAVMTGTAVLVAYLFMP